jgi:hypothetical protein
MTQANRVYITPPTNTSSHQPCLPPPVGGPREVPYSAFAEAAQDRHPLAHLIRLRDEAAAEVERLLAFLDATDGDIDLEPYLTGWNGDGDNDDREGDPADDRQEDDGESGIADLDGYMEQCPERFAHCDVSVEA